MCSQRPLQPAPMRQCPCLQSHRFSILITHFAAATLAFLVLVTHLTRCLLMHKLLPAPRFIHLVDSTKWLPCLVSTPMSPLSQKQSLTNLTPLPTHTPHLPPPQHPVLCWFQPGMILLSEDNCTCHHRRSTTVPSLVEVRDAAKHPTTHRQTPQQTIIWLQMPQLRNLALSLYAHSLQH